MILFVLLWGLSCGSAPSEHPEHASPTTDQASAAPEPAKDLKARHGAMFKELRALVKDLQESGRYDCCIEGPCSHCAMMMGGCSCGEGLRRGEPVCEECALMWIRGLGAESGVDPATVRSFLEAERIINATAAESAAKHGATHGAKHGMKHNKRRKRKGKHAKH